MHHSCEAHTVCNFPSEKRQYTQKDELIDELLDQIYFYRGTSITAEDAQRVEAIYNPAESTVSAKWIASSPL